MSALSSICVLKFNNSVLLFCGGVEYNPYACIHEKANINICILITKLEKSMCIVKRCELTYFTLYGPPLYPNCIPVSCPFEWTLTLWTDILQTTIFGEISNFDKFDKSMFHKLFFK